MKETSNELAYALYAHDNAPRPAAYVNPGGSNVVRGSQALPLNAWTHLAVTYDGAAVRLYVDGTEVDSQPLTGTITGTSRPLRIGGNSVWGEYFNGLIDEVRVYDRALSPAELVVDMGTPVGG
jgi:hypothetical protein